MKRAERLALHHGDLGFARGDPGDVGRHQAKGVEDGVDGFESRQDRVEDLERLYLFSPNEIRDLERGAPGLH